MRTCLFTFPKLVRAYYRCRRNKRRTMNAARFELRFEDELLCLEKELSARTYRPGRSICFAVTDPKLREVFAADFRDRVVHHLLVGYLEPIFEPKFIDHSYACRKGKGALKAIQTLQNFGRRITANGRRPAHYIHIDISAFFTSLDRGLLLKLVENHIQDPAWRWLAKTVISHDPTADYLAKGDLKALGRVPPHKSLFTVAPGLGLPIGNLTSQFFANVYLNELDQFAKHILKVPYYIRYVDDIIMLSRDPDELKWWRNAIDGFLRERLNLRLQPDKEVLQRLDRGLNFLGYVIYPGRTLVRNRTVRRLKQKLYEFDKRILRPQPYHPIRLWTPELCREFRGIYAAINSYYGLFGHADTFRLRRHLYEKHFGALKLYLLPADNDYSYFIWSEDA